MDAISDDYYEVMSLKFLVSEFERTKEEKQKYLKYMDKSKHEENYIIRSQALNKHVKRLKHKEREILNQVNKLCKLIGVDEPTIASKLHALQVNIEKLIANK
mgnify:FL=1